MPTASVAAALISLAVASGGATGPTLLFRLQDPALEESSGLAVSQLHDGVVWSHADGGDTAEVMAVDGRGRHGRHRAAARRGPLRPRGTRVREHA